MSTFLDLSLRQKTALGHIIYLISSGPIAQFLWQPLNILFEIKDEVRFLEYWFEDALNSIPGDLKRQIALMIITNVKTKEIPLPFFLSLKSTLIGTPLCDGPIYGLLTIMENAFTFFPETWGSPILHQRDRQRLKILFTNSSSMEIEISLGDYGSDYLDLSFWGETTKAVFNGTICPSQDQVDHVMKGLILDNNMADFLYIGYRINTIIPMSFGPFTKFEVYNIESPYNIS